MISNWMMDIGLVVDITQWFLWLGALTYLLESFINPSLFAKNGYLSWDALKAFSKLPPKHFLFSLLRFSASAKGFMNVIGFQFLLLSLLAFGLLRPFNLFLIALIFCIQFVINFRVRPVLSAPFQMRYMLYLGLLFYYLTGHAAVQNMAIIFICFQSLFSYLFSGILKIKSPSWRNGSALIYALSSGAHGKNLTFAKTLHDFPLLPQTLSWLVLIFECLLPLLIFTGPAGAVVFIFCGVVFHLTIATVMGFNDFLFVFLAPYPSILYFASQLLPY